MSTRGTTKTRWLYVVVLLLLSAPMVLGGKGAKGSSKGKGSGKGKGKSGKGTSAPVAAPVPAPPQAPQPPQALSPPAPPPALSGLAAGSPPAAAAAVQSAPAVPPSCGTGQYLRYGTCTDCGTGQVGLDDFSGCTHCTTATPIATAGGGTTGSGRIKSGETSDAVCRPAEGVCGSSQYARYGVCTQCGNGQVADPTHSFCLHCTQATTTATAGGDAGPGRIKNQNGIDDAVCRAADGVCGSSEYARYGACTQCGNGQVATPDHSTCIYCTQTSLTDVANDGISTGVSADFPAGPGRVKNENNIPNAKCLPINPQGYAPLCGYAQYSQYGRCENCPDGKVATFDHSDCVYCSQSPGVYTSFGRTGAGSIKVWEHWPARDADDEKHGMCKSAVGRCGTSQFSQYGRCNDCPAGKVATTDHSTCVYCTLGSDTQTRGGLAGPGRIRIGTGSDAVCGEAEGQCLSSQFSQYGRCNDCPAGKVATTDHSTCVYCTLGSDTQTGGGLAGPGRVRVGTGSDAVCAEANTVCSSTEFAQYGRCNACPGDQVATDDNSRCVAASLSVGAGLSTGTSSSTSSTVVAVMAVGIVVIAAGLFVAQRRISHKLHAADVDVDYVDAFKDTPVEITHYYPSNTMFD